MAVTVFFVIAGVVLMALVGYWVWQGYTERDHEDRERRFDEVIRGQAEPAGMAEELFAGQGRITRDPIVQEVLVRTLDAPGMISAEEHERLVSECDGSDTDSAGELRFLRMRESGEPLQDGAPAEWGDYTVFEAIELDLGFKWVLVKRTALSLQCSRAIGAGEFDPTDAFATRHWLETSVNDPSNRIIWVDIYERWAGGGSSIEECLMLVYDEKSHRACWPSLTKNLALEATGNSKSNQAESSRDPSAEDQCFCGCQRRVTDPSNASGARIRAEFEVCESMAFHLPGMITGLEGAGFEKEARTAAILGRTVIRPLGSEGFVYLQQACREIHENGRLSDQLDREIDDGKIRLWSIKVEMFVNLFGLSVEEQAEQMRAIQDAGPGKTLDGLFDLFDQTRQERREVLHKPERSGIEPESS
jgi:hypothetical protein